VHGRLSYEGKLVAAVLDAKLGIKLFHHFTGNPTGEDYRIYLSDRLFTDDIIAELKPGFSKSGWRVFDGSVAEWKTAGTGTPWTPKNYKRMLIYRGTRDWTRIYESALMLGVYSDDEMLDLIDDARARRATPVASMSLADRLSAAKIQGSASNDGFSHEHVTRETGGETKTEAQPDPIGAESSAQEASTVVSEGVQDRVCESTPSPDSNSSLSPMETDKPAAVKFPPDPIAAGDLSASADGSAADEGAERLSMERPADGDGASIASPSPSLLPDGWALEYAAALRRAQKKDSLTKYGKQFWETRPWPNEGPDRETALAIFAAFNDHFGNKEQIEDMLRELV
jgi:hypothetical protein